MTAFCVQHVRVFDSAGLHFCMLPNLGQMGEGAKEWIDRANYYRHVLGVSVLATAHLPEGHQL